MEYISYILITFVIVATCYVVMRPDVSPEQQKIGQAKSKKQAKESHLREEASRAKQVLQRELLHVPTPWGWPGHEKGISHSNSVSAHAQEVHGVGETIHHFVDRLVSEKRTVDSREYLLRKNASLRALIEDRYGRASTMKEVSYKKVKAPRLRDPNAPHDQMDNFPSGKVDQIMSRIPAQKESTRSLHKKTAPRKALAELKEMRTPWGW